MTVFDIILMFCKYEKKLAYVLHLSLCTSVLCTSYKV